MPSSWNTGGGGETAQPLDFRRQLNFLSNFLRLVNCKFATELGLWPKAWRWNFPQLGTGHAATLKVKQCYIEKKRGTQSRYILNVQKCHSSHDGENSAPRPFNHSPWWCVGKERVQTCNHWTNMWKGWFIWNYRGREKQKSPFLPFEWERDVKKWTNGAVLLCLSLAPRPSAVSSNCSLRGCNNFRRNIMSENIANKIQTSRTDCEEPYLQIQLKSKAPEAKMVLLFAKIWDMAKVWNDCCFSLLRFVCFNTHSH